MIDLVRNFKKTQLTTPYWSMISSLLHLFGLAVTLSLLHPEQF